jgi:S1-C subfamily serine protease
MGDRQDNPMIWLGLHMSMPWSNQGVHLPAHVVSVWRCGATGFLEGEAMTGIISIILCFIGICTFASGAELAKPDVPDPYGLGERLALIDYLHEKMGAAPPAGATVAELTALYWNLRNATSSSQVDDAALAHDRLQRLRRELKDNFKIDAPATADEATLAEMLSQQKKAVSDQALAQVLEQAAAHDHPQSSEAAAASASADVDAGQAHMQSLQGDMRSERHVLDVLSHQLLKLQDNLTANQALLVILGRKEAQLRTAHNQAVEVYNKELSTHGSASDATRATMSATAAADEAATTERLQLEQATALIQGQADEVGARMAKQNQRITDLDRQVSQASDQVHDAQQRKDGAGAPAGGVASNGVGAAHHGAEEASAFENRVRQSVVMIMVEGRGLGTGFFVTKGGLLVTNAHVVGDGQHAITATWDAQVHKATIPMHIVQILPTVDLALLRAEGSGPFQALPLHEQYALARPLIAVGFPLATAVARSLQTSATDIVMTRGTLSAVRHQGDVVAWLQHDCRLASGNSGGPLIDLESGAVIGVNAAVISSEAAGGHGDGMSLAIPVRVVQESFAGYLRE